MTTLLTWSSSARPTTLPSLRCSLPRRSARCAPALASLLCHLLSKTRVYTLCACFIPLRKLSKWAPSLTPQVEFRSLLEPVRVSNPCVTCAAATPNHQPAVPFTTFSVSPRPPVPVSVIGTSLCSLRSLSSPLPSRLTRRCGGCLHKARFGVQGEIFGRLSGGGPEAAESCVCFLPLTR